MDRPPSLTILIPAYNEEDRIGRTLEAYLAFFTPDREPPTQLLVIVNGSRDRTAQVVQQYMAKFANLRCIVEPHRVGKGGALILGFRKAATRVVGFVDADGSTPPEEFQKLVEALDHGDVAIGSRWIEGAVVEPRQPLQRRIASRIFNILVRLLFGVAVTDTQCGAKVFRAEVIEKILPSLGITQWAFDVDLLFQCRRHGFRIREVPTKWSDQSGSRLKIVRASMEMFLAIVRLRLLYSPFRFVVAAYDFTVGKLIRLRNA